MKIISLHIYGFGKFQDKVITDISRSFHLFYGENEAGKSTILAFIRAILFGFPTRQQKDERYEPKSGSAYGGRITIEMKKYGQVTIERTKGKATGDVKVFLQDGTTGTEEDLKTMLAGIDRSLFQGIFSFGLNDLNDMSQVQSEELGKFLYGVGMSGRSSIIDLEKDITKKQEELFKPKGKNPELNQALQELEQMKKKLHELSKEEKLYVDGLQEKSKLEELIKEKLSERDVLKSKIKDLERQKQMAPLFNRKKSLQYQLSELPPLARNFPMDGLKQLDEYNVKMEAIQEQILEIEKKKEILAEKQSQIQVEASFLALEDEINNFQKRVAKYEQIIQDKQAVQQTLANRQKSIKQLLESLGDGWNEQSIKNCNTTFTVKEEMKERSEAIKKLSDQIHSLEIELDRRNILIHEKKLQEEKLKQSLPSTDKMNQIELELEELRRQIKEEEILRQEIAFLKSKTNQNNYSKKPIPMYLLLILFFLFGTWSVLNSDWIFSGLSIIAIFILLWYMKDFSRTQGKGLYQEELKEKEKKYELFLSGDLDEALRRKQQERKEAEEVQQKFERVVNEREFEESFVEQLVNQQRDISEALKENEYNFLNWCKEKGFGVINNPIHMIDIFAAVVETKNLMDQIEESLKRLQDWATFEEEITFAGQRMASVFQLDRKAPFYYLAEKSSELMKKEQEKAREKNQLEIMLKELSEEALLIEEKSAFYKSKREELIRSVGAVDEQAFRILANQNTKSKEIEKELVNVNAQIFTYCSSEDEQKQLEEKMWNSSVGFEGLAELEDYLKELEELIRVYENQLIAIRLKLSHLEDATTYTQLVQQFEMKKTEFQEKARQWAVYQMSLKLIDEAKRIYETKRQPFVLKKGCEFFQIMTNGKYDKLYAPVGENTFVVENHDGVRFTPSELSQGTVEQLYLSLRFAMACVYQSHIPFPIIMDDILVNFDAKRREGAKKVIEMMADNHQILFFTCHKHMVDLFENKEMLALGE